MQFFEKKVTVLIPTYNRQEKLKRAIDSVLNQTYANLTLIVCDNASEDDTTAVVSSYMQKDSRVIYYRHDINVGMNANFNFALTKVNTPYFCFLSDDDFYLPSFIAESMQGFEKCPEASFTVLEAPVVNEGEQEKILWRALSAWPKEGLYLPGEGIEMVTGGHHPIITACIFHEDVKADIYFSDEVTNISDMPILITIVAKHSFYLSKSIAMFFVRHKEAAGNSVDWSAWSKLEKYVEKNETIPRQTMKTIKKSLRHKINNMFFNHLVHYEATGEKEQFVQLKHLIANRRWGSLMLSKFLLRNYSKKVSEKLRLIFR